jgi:hypothetical protein
MLKLSIQDVRAFIDERMKSINAQRVHMLETVTLKQIFSGINPYWFRIEKVDNAHDLIERWLDHYLFPREMSLLDDLLVNLGAFAAMRVQSAEPSDFSGVDLEFAKGKQLYLMSIFTSNLPINQGYIHQRTERIRRAQNVLRLQNTKKNVIAIHGFCYGKAVPVQSKDFLDLRGQVFWKFVSGEDHFYIDIDNLISSTYRSTRIAFKDTYVKVVVRLWQDFLDEYISDYNIDWEKLLRSFSGKN